MSEEELGAAETDDNTYRKGKIGKGRETGEEKIEEGAYLSV